LTVGDGVAEVPLKPSARWGRRWGRRREGELRQEVETGEEEEREAEESHTAAVTGYGDSLCW
jgi:hypothetical protein